MWRKRPLLLGMALGTLIVVVPAGGALFLLNRMWHSERAGGSSPLPEKAGPKPEEELPEKVVAIAKAKKEGTDDATVKEPPANLRTSANGIDYELASSRMNGRVWELTLKATKKSGNRGSVVLWRLQATTEDGKEFQLPPGKVTYQQILLTMGKPVEIKIAMCTLPPTARKLARVVITDHQSAFGKGAEPIVFKDVPIEPVQETGEKAPPNLRTTAGFVDYEVTDSRMKGPVWELTLKATARGGRSLLLWGMQVTTEDGKKIQLPAGKVMAQTVLSEGKPVSIKITMNNLPPGVTKLKQVALVEHGTAFSTGTEPVVFLDVPIEPDIESTRPPGNEKK